MEKFTQDEKDFKSPQMNHNKIILFTCGDSNDISTWSNVPYLFTKTLEEKGFRLHRVDISPNKTLNRIFNTTSYLIFKRVLKRNACPEFHRTWLHRFITYRRIKKVTIQNPDIQFNLFLSFAFYNKYSKKPNVLWCDWSDRVVIERLGREPKFYETASLRHEDNVMKKADKIYTMFPKCKEHMEELYRREIIYINRNVVNTVFEGEFNIKENIRIRLLSKTILFIGNIRYIGAAKELIQAYNILKEKDKSLELHIIGMTDEQLEVMDKDIHCHGYLWKNVKEERDLYYSLLHNCKVFVNPAQQWGGYSSSIEAMYYGCPIIVAPYDDFVCEFGENIDFGEYTNGNDLDTTIANILYASDEEYSALCKNAYDRVNGYTWNNYVDAFLKSLKEEGILQ
mgnify:FL=1